MVLSDRTIREELASGRLVIDPFDDALLQPSSVDVRVADQFRVFHNNRRTFIDVRQPSDDLTELVTIADGEAFILHPGEFVLGSTLERVALPDDLVARLEGKSSLGRLGLLIHSTAGYVDPGFNGTITLELSNVAPAAHLDPPRHGDRPDLLPADDHPGRAALPRQVPGAERADGLGVPPGVRAGRVRARPRTRGPGRRGAAMRSPRRRRAAPTGGSTTAAAAQAEAPPATSAGASGPPTASITRATAMKAAWMT